MGRALGKRGRSRGDARPEGVDVPVQETSDVVGVGEVGELDGQFLMAKSRITELQTFNWQLIKENTDLNVHNKGLQGLIDNIEVKRKELAQKLAQTENELRQARQDLAKAQVERDQFQHEAQSNKTIVDENVDEITKLNIKIAELEGKKVEEEKALAQVNVITVILSSKNKLSLVARQLIYDDYLKSQKENPNKVSGRVVKHLISLTGKSPSILKLISQPNDFPIQLVCIILTFLGQLSKSFKFSKRFSENFEILKNH